MFVDVPRELILIAAGAFLLGWIFSAFISRLMRAFRSRKRDPRDDRIRELEAELRIAQSRSEESSTSIEQLEEQLKETVIGIERRDNVITEQQEKLDRAGEDLKESVIKTRELRAELAERATENVHAEAKIREVETELSVAQASSDLIATGVLDYSLTQDGITPEDEDESSNDGAAEVSKAAT